MRRTLLSLVLGAVQGIALADSDAPVDANQLTLDASGTGLLSIGDGTILEPGQMRSMAVIQHLSSPIVRETVSGTELESLVPRREQLDLAFSIGALRFLQVSARLPLILSQPSTGLTGAEGQSVGWADPEIGLHSAILDGQIFPVQLGVSVPMTIPVGRADSWMSHGGFTVEPRLVLATLNGPVRVASRVGYRVQPEADLLHYQTGGKLRAAVGLSWVESDTDQVGIELVADLDIGTESSDILSRLERQSIELLAGYSHDLQDGFGIMAGLGTGLSSALPTPRWRALVAFTWSKQAVEIDPCKHIPKGQPLPPECPDPIRDDLDQDGILNDVDDCPVDPEDYDGLLDTDGCPEDDADLDGILDPDDICPLEPETFDGVRDDDGCPDDQLVALTRTSVVQLQRVSFDFAKATLEPESEPVM